MAKRLQLKGGTTAQHSTFTGANREVTVDTDKDTLVVHDGSTAGGFPLAKLTDTDLLNDTTPQLGGDLDVNGNSIVSVSNGNISITPDGTGKVIVDGLSHPTADGTADQVLKTDGSGNLSFGDVSGGTSWQSSIVTGTTLSAVAGNGYWIDTTSNACTVTLPASASVGDTIEFSDYARNWGNNAVTLNTNSLNFQGNTSPNPVYDVNGQSVRIVYSGATKGWIPTVDDDVTLETPQSYSVDFLVVAGGGGGGSSDPHAHNGGGGAGGFRTSTQTVNPGTTITVTVGDGGPATGQGGTFSKGSDSSISGTGLTTITSTGGGGGKNSNNNNADGGSGGGGGGPSPSNIGGSGNTPSTSPSQGNNGGNHNHAAGNYPTGGGGGAGAVGGNGGSGTGSGVQGGAGGDGLQSSITGTATYYAGGGGGACYPDGPGTAGPGGLGGGGAGGDNANATSGTVNTGGGGGGVNANSLKIGGSGGKGVVILRMPTASYTGTTTGSPTVTDDGSFKVVKFTGSGSYTA